MLSVITETCRSRNEVVREMIARVPEYSIGEVMAELLKIEMIRNDSKLHTRCCNLLIIITFY